MTHHFAALCCFAGFVAALAGIGWVGRWLLNGAAAAMVNDVGGDTRVSRVA